jgi:regulator of sigma E protease
MPATLTHILGYVYVALGFGFVIFFHELGHFLAAKYCDVKVEQFAVGFGPAIVSWRKGLGFRRGTSGPELERLQQKNQDGVATVDISHLGETEYRLNWIPLGGYVKMLGQDDLKPGVVVEDPRSYNSKSIRGRMLIVSAGVIMNIILAAVGFMIVFLIGYPAPPAKVGWVISGSPAMKAATADGKIVGLKPGDEILEIAGNSTIGDFTKIVLNVALSAEGEKIPFLVKHRNGTMQTLYITPSREGSDAKGMLAIGIGMPPELAGADMKDKQEFDDERVSETAMKGAAAIKPGDIITQINGQNVGLDDYWKLSDAVEASDGQPVDVTVQSNDKKFRHESVLPHLQPEFGEEDVNFLGLVPRTMIATVAPESKAFGSLKPGDIVLSLEMGSDQAATPTMVELKKRLTAAGDLGQNVSMTVLGAGDTKPRAAKDLSPSMKLGNGKHGLGVGLQYDEQHLVVADTLKGSSTDGKIPPGSTIQAINGKPVSNWFEVRKIVMAVSPSEPISVTYLPPTSDKPATAMVTPSPAEIQSAQLTALAPTDPQFQEATSPLKTSNPLVAIKWGVIETRDLILQFYLTLQRMFEGSVSVKNMMGPVGMFNAGSSLADRGGTWLLWFLANISANLAVVNFLPIPIVDGGLFTFLVLEKIQGKPLSSNAQKIAQMVGLALILSVFLLVTYQDVARGLGWN